MTRRRRVNLEGYIGLPALVRLQSDVLSESYWTSIGTFDVRLKPPGVDMGVISGLRRPNVSRYGAEWLRAQESILWPWGWVVSAANNQAQDVAVEGLVAGIALDGRKPRDGLRAVLDGYPDWFRRLKDWIEVYSDQDLDPHYTGHEVQVRHGRFWTIGQKANSWVIPQGIRRTVQESAPGSLTKKEWKRILDKAGSTAQPADERLLLRDVATAVGRGQYRRAVLDSGTLVELSLWELIERAHAKAPSSLGAVLLSDLGNATLGRLWSVASQIGSQLPRHFAGNGFVQLRNRTAHRTTHKTAYTPTRAEATKAHWTATELLDAAFPLPPLS